TMQRLAARYYQKDYSHLVWAALAICLLERCSALQARYGALLLARPSPRGSPGSAVVCPPGAQDARRSTSQQTCCRSSILAYDERLRTKDCDEVYPSGVQLRYPRIRAVCERPPTR